MSDNTRSETSLVMVEWGIPASPNFDTTEVNLSVQWAKWIAKLDNLLVSSINIMDANRKKSDDASFSWRRRSGHFLNISSG